MRKAGNVEGTAQRHCMLHELDVCTRVQCIIESANGGGGTGQAKLQLGLARFSSV
jgi:hypothetical protein